MRGVVKFYGGDCAVRGVDLVVEDGELIALVGPSGCGKSTMLRMIAGLEEMSEGTLRIGGKVMNGVEPRGRDVAMVFQDYALYPHMTTRQNIAFGLRMRGIPAREIARRVEGAAEILRIGDCLHRRPGQLSGGQRQRVAMGRAIVREPNAFLFDEPLSNLDAKLRVEMRTQIKRLHRMLRATMIYVTHDQVEAMTLADRVVVLSGGSVIQEGPPMQLYNSPNNRFVGEFIGSPQMNIMPGMLDRSAETPRLVMDGAMLELGAIDAGDGARIDVGIRPEDLCSSAKAGARIKATVDLQEPLGSDTLAICRFGQNEITARLAPDATLVPGETIHLDFDPAKLHYFSQETGKRINSDCRPD